MTVCEDLGNGISVIDTGLMADDMVACYLVQDGDGVAIIETGNYQTCDRILSILKQKNISPDQVNYIIVTHIHLDHAGGASHLMNACPNAVLVVHPSGAKHMINPEKLITASTQVYGEQRFAAMYGTIEPIASERVRTMNDGETIALGSRTLLFEYTPGHAYHHFCIWDETDKSWFTGDTFGLCYKPMKLSPQPLLIPTTTPTQFDPEALKQSISKLLARNPRRMLLTHHGALAIEDRHRIEDWLHKQIDDFVELTRREMPNCENHHMLADRLLDYYYDLTEQEGLDVSRQQVRSVLAMDLELNAQGLWYWYNKHHSH